MFGPYLDHFRFAIFYFSQERNRCHHRNTVGNLRYPYFLFYIAISGLSVYDNAFTTLLIWVSSTSLNIYVSDSKCLKLWNKFFINIFVDPFCLPPLAWQQTDLAGDKKICVESVISFQADFQSLLDRGTGIRLGWMLL